MKIGKWRVLSLFVLFAGHFFWACSSASDLFSSGTEEGESGSGSTSGTGGTSTTTQAPAFFVYYKDSVFNFVIKDGTTNVTTSKMTWTVTAYDSSTGVVTVSCSLEPFKTIPLGSTFYFRKSSSGLEYSSSGSSWTRLADLGSPTDVGFLFFTKAAKPSGLLGSLKNGMQTTSVTHPGGTSQGVEVYSEYDNSGYDPYTYTDYSREYYTSDVGYAGGVTYNYDGSNYPPFVYKREIDLTSYKIYMPNGTIVEAGETKPAAPSNLTGSYTKNTNVWTGSGYEKRSYISLYWKDNSNNEVQFNIYMKSPTDGNWYPFSSLSLDGAILGPDSFPPNTMSGTLKRGYYMTWPISTYYFKLTAASTDLESDFSNEAAVTVYY